MQPPPVSCEVQLALERNANAELECPGLAAGERARTRANTGEECSRVVNRSTRAGQRRVQWPGRTGHVVLVPDVKTIRARFDRQVLLNLPRPREPDIRGKEAGIALLSNWCRLDRFS